MNTIMQAIKNVYNGALIGSETNGIFFQEAPKRLRGEDVMRPYTIFEFRSEPTTAMNQLGRPDWENIDVLFSIYTEGTSSIEACYLFELLKDTFDPITDLGATNFDTVRVDRTNQELVPDPDEGWIYEVSYRIQLQREH